jgi:arylsulfatase A-like enzyme
MAQPNIIIFLTDDQGYGDLSCMGATDFKTPHLDQLAGDGVRFTNWYSNSPVCSPSRAALLTGRYPGNAGVRAILAGHRTATGLPPSVPTIATAVKKLGYRTAMFGKWHLGLTPECRPNAHGFDEFFGFMAGCIDYYSHIYYWQSGINPTHDLWHNNREIYDNGRYFTELIAEKSVDYVRSAAKSEQPFLLYVPFNAPHYPMHAPKKYIDRFRDLSPDRRIMAAMISAVDDAVGDIIAELKRQNIYDNTFIYFQSDNGPSRETRNWLDGRADPYYGGSAGKLKGHKFSLYDGGIRSPGIISLPSRIPKGQVLDGIGAAMDVFPTILTLAGGNPAEYELNGSNVLPWIADGTPSPHADAPVFWEMQDQTAVRRGKWKLVLKGQLVEGAPPEDDVFLANLDDDMGERVNLKAKYPEVVRDLTELALNWRAKIEERWTREFVPVPTGTTAHK